jgi:hypothetical protein
MPKAPPAPETDFVGHLIRQPLNRSERGGRQTAKIAISARERPAHPQ